MFVLAEGAAPPGGRCLAQSLSAPTADSLRSKLTRAAICRSWPSAPDREGEQLQRGKYNRDAKKINKNKQLLNFGRSTRGVRGRARGFCGASAVDPREEGESCSSRRGHFSRGQSDNNRVIQPAEQPAGQSQRVHGWLPPL